MCGCRGWAVGSPGGGTTHGDGNGDRISNPIIYLIFRGCITCTYNSVVELLLDAGHNPKVSRAVAEHNHQCRMLWMCCKACLQHPPSKVVLMPVQGQCPLLVMAEGGCTTSSPNSFFSPESGRGGKMVGSHHQTAACSPSFCDEKLLLWEIRVFPEILKRHQLLFYTAKMVWHHILFGKGQIQISQGTSGIQTDVYKRLKSPN